MGWEHYRQKRNCLTNRGFSLTELLIIIAIIAIVTAITIPIYSDYMTRSKLVEIEYIDSVDRKDISIYLSENGGVFGSEDNFNSSSLKDKIEANNSSDCIVSKTVNYVDSETIDVNTDVDLSLC